MSSFLEEISEPCPTWTGTIKEEARARIIGGGFASGCRQGNRAIMRGLVLGLWPFIDAFPRSLIHGARRLPKASLFKERELVNALLHRGSQLLSGIKKDEEDHRKLWLETGHALGLQFPADFRDPTLPQTQTWIDAVNAAAAPSTLLLRFAAIEIIAETVSMEFLSSTAFTSVLGERGCEWFRVHAEHGAEMTHEELEMRLAFTLAHQQLSREVVSSNILQIVDLSIAAMEASAKMVEI